MKIPWFLQVQSKELSIDNCCLCEEDEKICLTLEHTLITACAKRIGLQKKWQKAYACPICLQCLWKSLHCQELSVFKETHLFLYIPTLISFAAKSLHIPPIRDVELVRYIDEGVFKTMQELRKKDLQFQEAGLAVVRSPLIWRGHTGNDLTIFANYLSEWLQEEDAFCDDRWTYPDFHSIAIQEARKVRAQFSSILHEIKVKVGVGNE